jgi:radical SAM superfamily enzyme YgiQ (UPF0313 family)
MKVVLISPYEIGRQPFGLASPAAMMRAEGFEVNTIDLSLERIVEERLRGADLIAIYLAMHTATRIAIEVLPRIRSLMPNSHLCAYGLYAPMNADLLRDHGVKTVLGGEFEQALLQVAQACSNGNTARPHGDQNGSGRVSFVVPDRSTLPDLTKYAQLVLPDGSRKVMGFAEATRGCKHLCRHCPIVPIYNGRFRAIPCEIVLADIENQVGKGARHISFGDPDFLNGPTHSRRILERMHLAFPGLTFDATIKVEHLLNNADFLPVLRETGCLFVTSAIESVDDIVLEHLQKHHTAADFEAVVRLTRQVGIDLAPTFVAFTPWTTLDGYVNLLKALVNLRLVESVPPIQLAIRLLVPKGSYLLKIPGFEQELEQFDSRILGYPWIHRDPRVDELQAQVQAVVERAEAGGTDRRAIFETIWSLAHAKLGETAPGLPSELGQRIPHHTEAWYCCAEPTSQQLSGF